MKAITVQQPWAWALVLGGKDVENRTHAYTYRGPLAIHAGRSWSERGAADPNVRTALDRLGIDEGAEELAHPDRFTSGCIEGVVNLVDVHVAESGCCTSPWAEYPPRRMCHLVVENPRYLLELIPCRGRLGLWTPPADVLAQIKEQIPA